MFQKKSSSTFFNINRAKFIFSGTFFMLLLKIDMARGVFYCSFEQKTISPPLSLPMTLTVNLKRVVCKRQISKVS